MRVIHLVSLLAVAVCSRASAQSVPSLAAERSASTVRIDGRIDEPAWAAAPVAAGFTQRRPSAGTAATQQVEARVLYDDEAVLIAFRLYDTAPDSIVATLARRDFNGFSDWAHVYLDSYHDRRTAFRFSVNAAGVKSDAAVAGDDEAEEQAGWDAVWDAAVQRDSDGWTAEFRIPLTQLRFRSSAAGTGSTWGIQFARDIARYGERAVWAPAGPEDQGFVSRFGELRGLEVRSGRRLEVVPYVVGRLTREPGNSADPFHRPNDAAATAGADIRYGVAADLTLSATLNPDFGQVEADPSEVNLTGIETFLTEKRPFFVEGADIFRMEMAEASWIHGTEEVFYSRRIGRPVQASIPSGALYSEFRPASRILGAAKLSGKTGSGWALGALTAVTGAEYARFVTAEDTDGRALVEPLTSYSVARLTREVMRGRAAFGAVLTATQRRLSDGFARLPASAYVGGVDGRMRFGARAGWEATGSVLGSRLGGDAAAIDAVRQNGVHRHQRPDADHIGYAPGATQLSGYSATASVAKNDGRWRGSLGGHLMSPGFDANDLGYHTVSDLARVHALLGFQQMRPGTFRRWWGWFNGWSAWTHGGEQTGLGAQLNANVEFRNQWLLSGSVRRDRPVLSPTVLRGGPALRLPARMSVAASLTGDQRRPVNFAISGAAARGAEGERVERLSPRITVRPSPRLDLSIQPSVQRTRHPAQWLGQWAQEGRPVQLVGALDQTTASLTTRLNLTFTRDLSFQLYAQPFASEGHFGALREVTDPRAARFEDRFRDVRATRAPEGDRVAIDRNGDGMTDFDIAEPSFDVKELKVNAVLRWEARAGSTLFLVWSQERSARGAGLPDRDLWDDAGDLLRLPSTNVLLLKASLWMGW